MTRPPQAAPLANPQPVLERPRKGDGSRGRARAVRLPAEVRRANILDAAAMLFRRSGYQAVTLQDIAEAVGLLKGSIYHYFSSKEELLSEVLIGANQAAQDLFNCVSTAEGSGLECAALYVELHARWAIRYLERVEVMLRDWHYLPGDQAKEITRLRRRFLAYLTEQIERGQKDGDIDQRLDPQAAAHNILGMLNWLGQWYQPGGRLGEDQVVDLLRSQVVNSLHGVRK